MFLGGTASAEEGAPLPSPTRWAMDAGLGVRLWDPQKGTQEEIDYLDRARVGAVTSFEVAVFPWGSYGAGIMFATFHSGTSDSSMTYLDQTQQAAQDAYFIPYLAPTLNVQRSFAGDRFCLVAQVGGGVFYYRDETKKGPFPGISDAFAPGAHVAVSLDYRLLPRFAVGGGVRALYGKTPNLRYNAIDADLPPVSLSRVDITAGVRFYP